MKNILVVFDYAFYKIVKVYKRWDGYDGDTAKWGLVLVQMMVILDILGIPYLEFFNKAERQAFNKYGVIIIIVLVIGLYIFNSNRYKGKYFSLDEKWKNETKKQKIVRGLLVILMMLIPLLFPALILNLKDYTQ